MAGQAVAIERHVDGGVAEEGAELVVLQRLHLGWRPPLALLELVDEREDLGGGRVGEDGPLNARDGGGDRPRHREPQLSR